MIHKVTSVRETGLVDRGIEVGRFVECTVDRLRRKCGRENAADPVGAWVEPVDLDIS